MTIEAIYPPVDSGVLHGGCFSCAGDVKMDCGFVDTERKPAEAYLCLRCAKLSVSRTETLALSLQSAQEKYRKTVNVP